MVAVTMMAFVITMLTEAAVDGMRVEGEAHRRLEASLIADRLLADIESQMMAGVPPEIGRDEAEEEPYRISVEARPLDLGRLGIVPDTSPGSSSLAALVGSEGLGSTPPLVEVEIRVEWDEGIHTLDTRRTTFSFDAAAVAAQLPAVASGDDSDEDEDE